MDGIALIVSGVEGERIQTKLWRVQAGCAEVEGVETQED
jgi:hypothetical protein